LKIVIVGGGTAGWLAALMIHKLYPMHKLTVIESSAIGIVGAGEGSTGMLTSIINGDFHDFGCDMMDFLKETGATIKYGIHHKDWNTVGESYLAPLNGSPTSGNTTLDTTFALAAELIPSKMHKLHVCGLAMEHLQSPFNLKTFKFSKMGYALHFDAHAVGRYFKKVVMKDNEVLHVDDEIQNVVLNDQGEISQLKLKSGGTVGGEFFIDASGFSRVLMKQMNNPWVSYRKNLPVNSAMPFLLDYEDGETPEPWTTAWAQSSGWMWQIPTQHRKGCGYVFDDNFITPDQAQQEIETTLGRKINPIRILKFDTGRLENAWVKNCVAVGLCSAFAEPLEATSIHSTIVQLLSLTFEYMKLTKEETCNPASIKMYNKHTARMYDDFKDFLNIHYMGGRTDSEFWKYIAAGTTQTDNTRDLLEMANTKCPTNSNFNQYRGGVDWGLYSYVMFGNKSLPATTLVKEMHFADFVSPGLRSHARNILEEYGNTAWDQIKDNMSYKNFIEFLRK
jgi:tryptophan halogenase